jgi:hypothetical protein
MTAILLASFGTVVESGLGQSPPEKAQVTPLFGGYEDVRSGLVDVPDMVVGPTGIFLINGMDRKVMAFTLSGDFKLAWGGEGQGPGEFMMPTRIGLLGDSIWVVDPMARRVTFFNKGGAVLGTSRVRAPRLGGLLEAGDPWAILTDGSFVSEPRYNISPGYETDLPRVPFLLVSAEGVVLDTLAEYPTANRWWAISGESDPTGTGPRFVTPNPFAFRPTYGASGNGEFLAWAVDEVRSGSSRIVVNLLSVESGQRRVWRTPYSPKPVTEELVREVVIEKVAQLSEAPPFQMVPEARLTQWVRSGLPLPGHLPPVTAVVLSEDGESVWLRREMSVRQDVRWEVYDQAGVLLGGLSLPGAMTVHASFGGALWGSMPDSLGVPLIVRVDSPSFSGDAAAWRGGPPRS